LADEGVDETASGASRSRSIGSPDRGHLRRGVELTSTEHLRARSGPSSSSFGTAELVSALQRAAARVAEAHPGPPLVVGDLSDAAGGRLRPHRSHRSGRDADVSFYLRDARGRPVDSPGFVRLLRGGCGEHGGREYCLDAARSFAFLAALAMDPEAGLQYVFVAPDLRDLLLAAGERDDAPAEVIRRVRLVTEPARGSGSHRSHFHLRVYCSEDDRPDCVDEPPYHSWYQGSPSPLRAEVAARRAAERRRAEAQARARARARRHRRGV
jgi:penicillin-insensitive murein endopeptidase